jgi:hypothetical protein
MLRLHLPFVITPKATFLDGDVRMAVGTGLERRSDLERPSDSPLGLTQTIVATRAVEIGDGVAVDSDTHGGISRIVRRRHFPDASHRNEPTLGTAVDIDTIPLSDEGSGEAEPPAD